MNNKNQYQTEFEEFDCSTYITKCLGKKQANQKTLTNTYKLSDVMNQLTIASCRTVLTQWWPMS